MGPVNRKLGPRIKAAAAASTELQERDALKSVGLAAAMTDALLTRGVPAPAAHLAAELGLLAFKQGYAKWAEVDEADGAGLDHIRWPLWTSCARRQGRWAERFVRIRRP